MSLSGLLSSMVAAALVPSLKDTVIDSAPSTTCRAVSTVPSALTTTPAPLPARRDSPLPERVVIEHEGGRDRCVGEGRVGGPGRILLGLLLEARLHACRDVGPGQVGGRRRARQRIRDGQGGHGQHRDRGPPQPGGHAAQPTDQTRRTPGWRVGGRGSVARWSGAPPAGAAPDTCWGAVTRATFSTLRSQRPERQGCANLATLRRCPRLAARPAAHHAHRARRASVGRGGDSVGGVLYN